MSNSPPEANRSSKTIADQLRENADVLLGAPRGIPEAAIAGALRQGADEIERLDKELLAANLAIVVGDRATDERFADGRAEIERLTRENEALITTLRYEQGRLRELLSERDSLRVTVFQLKEAIYWALGEREEWPEEPPPIGGKHRHRYHFRTELRRRSGLPVGGIPAERPAHETESLRLEVERLTQLNAGLTHDFNTLLVAGSKVESERDRLRAIVEELGGNPDAGTGCDKKVNGTSFRCTLVASHHGPCALTKCDHGIPLELDCSKCESQRAVT